MCFRRTSEDPTRPGTWQAGSTSSLPACPQMLQGALDPEEAFRSVRSTLQILHERRNLQACIDMVAGGRIRSELMWGLLIQCIKPVPQRRFWSLQAELQEIIASRRGTRKLRTQLAKKASNPASRRGFAGSCRGPCPGYPSPC